MKSRITAAAAAAAIVATTLAGCGGGDSSSDSGSKTLTYWASNQGSSIEMDKKVLRPELDKFEKKTGIEVELEVIPWSDLLNRILGATTSGKGPDVVNIGNTWSASLQATGAFVDFDKETIGKVGGKDHFLETSLASTGAEGQDPSSVPLYGLAYGLYYNKKIFADAGLEPPANWGELIETGKKLTKPGKDQYGLSLEGASYTENAHFAFMFGRQHGAEIFDGDKPRFDSPEMVAGVKQYVDLIAEQKVANPSSAEYATDGPFVKDFSSGQSAMIMIQSFAGTPIEANGMKPDEYGVVPIPMPEPLPPGGKKVNSHVAGINIAAFKDSDNPEGALKLIEFLTGDGEQKILNKKYGTLPVTGSLYDDPYFQTDAIKTFQKVLATTAEPMPMIPQEAKFETLVGNAVKELLASAAAGKTVDKAAIKAKLSSANARMLSEG